ncbi:MAG: thioredoxin domain-containing protein, partial [Desulfopila sp.]
MIHRRSCFILSVVLSVCAIAFLTLAASAFGAADSASSSSRLQWQVRAHYQIPDKPVDLVHSLDGKYVFILTDQHRVMVYSAQGELQGSIPVDAGVSAIDIAPRAEMLYLINSEKQTFSALSVSFIRDIDISGSPFLGPVDAPVTMVLFTDFECPYCGELEPLLKQVVQRNPENVKLVFKNMPLQFHKFADPAARAALAAGKQGKFWEFHDALFGAEKLSTSAIKDIAVRLDLDMEQWQQDMASVEIRRKIYTDIQDAKKAGVTGTPT